MIEIIGEGTNNNHAYTRCVGTTEDLCQLMEYRDRVTVRLERNNGNNSIEFLMMTRKSDLHDQIIQSILQEMRESHG